MSKEYKMTADGLKKLEQELETLKTVTRKENAEKFITMPQSCVDVSQSGDTVTYYASVSAMEFMQDMKKEDIVKMAESIGALAEEF